MKTLAIVLIAFAVGLSACGKKKKKAADPAKPGSEKPTPGGDSVKVSSAYAIKLSEDGKSFTVEKAANDNDKKQKEGNCSLEDKNKAIVAEKNKPFSVELKGGAISVTNEAKTPVLQGKAADSNTDKVEGKYDAGNGLMFEFTKDTLSLEKTCKK